MKELADDKFEFDKNRRKFSKRVENTAEKGEIAHYKQFLLFPKCFQKNCTEKPGLVWEGVKIHWPPIAHRIDVMKTRYCL